MQSKLAAPLPEVSIVEKAFHDLQRIRREIDQLAAALSAALPQENTSSFDGVIDPRTGGLWRERSRLEAAPTKSHRRNRCGR
jgi:hypothetical protein